MAAESASRQAKHRCVFVAMTATSRKRVDGMHAGILGMGLVALLLAAAWQPAGHAIVLGLRGAGAKRLDFPVHTLFETAIGADDDRSNRHGGDIGIPFREQWESQSGDCRPAQRSRLDRRRDCRPWRHRVRARSRTLLRAVRHISKRAELRGFQHSRGPSTIPLTRGQ